LNWLLAPQFCEQLVGERHFVAAERMNQHDGMGGIKPLRLNNGRYG
jgi:hypothetical protein